MGNERFKAKVSALDLLRTSGNFENAIPIVRKALRDPSAYVVAKAAAVARQGYLCDLLPDVVAAFTRLLATGDDDPGCRAKDEIAKALKDLDHHDPAAYVLGLAHVQLEPVWGGKVDVAGPLRATCAQALVACDIDATALLSLLVDHFIDPDKWVRIDIARAIAQLDRPESALLLRLKALSGDKEAEVVGQCLLSLLEIAPVESLAFVARFLAENNDDVRFEAVNALAQAKSPEAVGHIVRFWAAEMTFELRLATVAALAASPHAEAAEFLLGIVRDRAGDVGSAALAALASSRFRGEMRERAAAEVARSGNVRLERAFAEHFSPT
jgi:HEAT repeat protein